MSLKLPATGAVLCLLAVGLYLHAPRTAMAGSSTAPEYTKTGEMLRPASYREWIYLTSGMDMSYTPKAVGADDASMFDNVFVNPEAYRSFLATGVWPDKTILVLEARQARSKGSINQHGHFQAGGIMDLEVHVKDQARFPGKWAFFSFDSTSSNGTLIPQQAPCYSCHADHAAVDTTFVQFYPTLLPIAETNRTLRESFRREEAAASLSK